MSISSNASLISNRSERIKNSKHAEKRCQQRGISVASIPLIKAFGEFMYDGRGAIRYSMTKSAMEHLLLLCGRTAKLEALRGVYIVESISDFTIITVAHIRH
jgi:hypothetical protein